MRQIHRETCRVGRETDTQRGRERVERVREKERTQRDRLRDRQTHRETGGGRESPREGEAER